MVHMLERLGLWLTTSVGGLGLLYLGMTASADTPSVVLGIFYVLGLALLAVGILGFASEVVVAVHGRLPGTPFIKPLDRAPEHVEAPTARPAYPISELAPATPAEDIPWPTPPKREFVQVTTAYLVGLFETHTTLEANRLLADFKGKWIPVSGQVEDVVEMGKDTYVQMFEDERGPLIALMFKGPWADRASTLRQGDQIRAIGKVERVDRSSVNLDPCELQDQSSRVAIS